MNRPDLNELKSFALTMSWAFPVIFGAFLPWLFSYNWQLWPFAISVVLMSLYLVKPSFIYYPFKFWSVIGGVMGWINTRIILSLSFYILIAPLGVVLRYFGKLQYKSKMPTNATSNYVKPEAESSKNNLENPF
ncbi:hypothetical protein KO525_09430 [Psychrosphaera sp. B3R10]|uniref:SxtJ family membrane protein n=1 Tax=unclassified Psychrosphaera TaxID=2641570 RepID=UPI001C09B855|nr:MULTISPECIES: SxtJ family membrane protein [unclassified Psychrosphaera]MBU2881391.1 hypothetical protein [Psychrosphaera sp. I2R16]MBU2989597.1 hypothetical protein [Psychrosphaera sp. B3R10]